MAGGALCIHESMSLGRAEVLGIPFCSVVTWYDVVCILHLGCCVYVVWFVIPSLARPQLAILGKTQSLMRIVVLPNGGIKRFFFYVLQYTVLRKISYLCYSFCFRLP